jgi:multicomponent Na+:H+ antiporter subunit D
MNTISIAWIVLPFVAGFLIFLLPKLDRSISILAAICSAGYALQLITSRWRSLSPGESNLNDPFARITIV